MRHPSRAANLVATFGGIGNLRPAPGTWGSLAALPVAWLLYMLGGPWTLVVATGLVTLAGLWATRAEIAYTGNTDPAHVVIDEVAGQWLALWPVVFGAAHAGAAVGRLWPGWVVAFVLFRLFDIWKPGPVGWADRRGDTVGVMLDDLIAGVFAGIGVGIFAVLWHGVLGL